MSALLILAGAAQVGVFAGLWRALVLEPVPE